MKIECPNCSFSKIVDESMFPKDRKVSLSCPKCNEKFSIKVHPAANATSASNISDPNTHELQAPSGKIKTPPMTNKDNSSKMTKEIIFISIGLLLIVSGIIVIIFGGIEVFDISRTLILWGGILFLASTIKAAAKFISIKVDRIRQNNGSKCENTKPTNHLIYVFIGISIIIVGIFIDEAFDNIGVSVPLVFFGGLMFFISIFKFTVNFTKKGIKDIKHEIKQQKEFEDKRLQDVIESLEDFSIDAIFTLKNKKAFIAADEKKRKIAIGGISENTEEMTRQIIHIKDVFGVDLVEDGKGLLGGSSAKNVLGSAAIGGLLFGEGGAIVGAIAGSNSESRSTGVTLKLSIDDIKMPYIGINFLPSSADKGSEKYKKAKQEAEKWYGIVSILMDREKRLAS